MNRNSNLAPFSQSIGRAFMFGCSLIVALSFARNFVPFKESAMPGVLLVSLGLMLLPFALKGRFPIAKPSKNDIMPSVPAILIAVVLTFYFFKAPHLPDFPSKDIFDHALSINDVANGATPTIQAALLYYAVRYILAFVVSASHLPALVGIRYGMALLVIISPFIVYDFGVNFFKNHRAAWIASLLYAGSGLWFSMVFDAGLLPTFYAILSALFLISVSMDFAEKKAGVSTAFVLVLSILNAFLSHYSILFLLMPLAAFAPFIADFRRGLVISSLIAIPLALGLVFFNGIIPTLLNFLQGAGTPFADTALGSLLPASSLKYLITDLGNDFFFALVIVPCFAAFVYQLVKKPDKMKLFLLAWFLFGVALAPLNFSAWRFAYTAEIPLLLIVAYALSLPFQKLKIRSVFELKVFGLMALMVFPTFIGSWNTTVIGTTMIDPRAFNAQQNADYRFVLWSKSHLHGTAVTPADISLTFSETLGGIPIYSGCESGIVGWYQPEQLSFFAIQKGAKYIVVTSGLDCQPPTVAARVGNELQNITLTPMKIITPATLGCPTVCLIYTDPGYINVFQIAG